MPESAYAYIIPTSTTVSGTTGYVRFDADTTLNNQYVQVVEIRKAAGLHPELYFKYVKSKLSVLQRMKMDRRIERIEKAFDRAVESGQDVLAGHFLAECVREARESAILAKGFKYFIEKEDVDRHKHNIRDGHISDTQLKDFTRPLPKDVMQKYQKSQGLFDGYVVYHYWNDEAEQKRVKKQKLNAEERSRMRDPVLFGWIRESNCLYFVADWIDEYCDLTFDEMTDAIGKEEEELTIPREPVLPTK